MFLWVRMSSHIRRKFRQKGWRFPHFRDGTTYCVYHYVWHSNGGGVSSGLRVIALVGGGTIMISFHRSWTWGFFFSSEVFYAWHDLVVDNHDFLHMLLSVCSFARCQQGDIHRRDFIKIRTYYFTCRSSVAESMPSLCRRPLSSRWSEWWTGGCNGARRRARRRTLIPTLQFQNISGIGTPRGRSAIDDQERTELVVTSDTFMTPTHS